jgi:hypothetical protein
MHTTEQRQAGRELDAEIAEKVMGLDVIQITCIDHRGAVPDIGSKSAPYKMSNGKMGVQATRIPGYSTDIAAAWQVAEKLGGYCYLWRDGGVAPLMFDGQWECKLRRDNDPDRRYYAVAPTAPLAICLAAIQAIGASPSSSGDETR